MLYSRRVIRLIEYLRQHLMIDFQGDLSVGKVRELLAGDDSRDAKQLLAKLVAERSGEGAAWLRLTAPPHIYDEIALIGLTEGLRAVIDCSGISSEFTMVEGDETGARGRVRW